MNHRHSFALIVLAATSLALLGAPVAAAACVGGSLIKASGPAVYYCGNDGKRYVFPTEKTFKTWYSDFSAVQTVSDTVLSTLPIGGNATYRPGVRLVKITTDPKVYAVDAGGLLRWLASESVAVQLYGSNWAKMVDDVPDAYFTNYRAGSDITAAAQFGPASATSVAASINVDKQITGSGSTGSASAAISLSPYASSLAQGQSTVATVSGNDADGIGTIYIFLGTSLVKSCPQSDQPTSATCNYQIDGASYGVGSTLAVSGQVVDKNGTTVKSDAVSLDITAASTGNSTMSLSLSPYASNLGVNQSTAATLTANDADGISAIRIYAGSTLVQTCSLSGQPTSATCAGTIYGSSYGSGSTVGVYGQVVDRNGLTVNSSTTNLIIVNGATSNNSDSSLSLSLSPYTSNLNSNQSTTVTLSGSDGDGISMLRIYAGSLLVQTCVQSNFPTNGSCSGTVNGNAFANGSTVGVYGQLTDRNGTTTNSSTTNLNIINTTSSSSSSGATVTLSFTPTGSTLAAGQSATVQVSGYDPDGVTTARIYVNGALVQTCTQATSFTVTSCSATLNGSTYASGSTVSVYGLIVDPNGFTTSSSTSSLSVTGTISGNAAVALSLSPFSTTLANGVATVATATASSAVGINTIVFSVNGGQVKACNQSGYPTSASCTLDLNGNAYQAGTTVQVKAEALDRNNQTITSNTVYLNIVASTGTSI